MALPNGEENIFKAFQSEIYLNPEKLEQAEQLEQSTQSRSDNKYS